MRKSLTGCRAAAATAAAFMVAVGYMVPSATHGNHLTHTHSPHTRQHNTQRQRIQARTSVVHRASSSTDAGASNVPPPLYHATLTVHRTLQGLITTEREKYWTVPRPTGSFGEAKAPSFDPRLHFDNNKRFPIFFSSRREILYSSDFPSTNTAFTLPAFTPLRGDYGYQLRNTYDSSTPLESPRGPLGQ